ncbi:ionotropic receptor 21a [Belonocnema kinseyi]|uniref:ionotropic receptor 21a n=1 Tax=Belonocnema kinseyi TaxID=2817044 RepID=UPI00143D0533|nr:ionotropic receptor 21a [Belonocnema kinseyi]
MQTKNSDELENLEAKATSLVKLLLYIKQNYFEEHPIVVIYDSNFEKHQPIEFKCFMDIFSSSFVQESFDFSFSEKSRAHLRDKIYNYIIFVEKVDSIKHLMKPDVKSKIVLITADTSWTIRDFLKSQLSRFYAHLLIVTQTLSRRVDSYLLFTHKLYVDGSGASEPILLTSWKSNSLTRPQNNLFPEKLSQGFKGHRLLVSTAHKPPFTMRRKILGTDNTEWNGIDIEVLRLLGNNLDFIAEFRHPMSSMYSETEAVINDISKADAPAAVGGIYQTADLLSHFDAPFAHVEDCASFISLTSTALPKYKAVMGPFQESVWLLLSAAYFIAIIPMTMNSHYSLASLIKRPGRLNHMFWFVFSTFTNSFSVKNPLLSSGLGKNSTSILIGIYWVFTIIITASYTGSIIAFITLPVYPPLLESSSQFSTYRYRIGTLDHDGWEVWFNHTTMDDPIATQLFNKLEYVQSIGDGVRNASRAYFRPYAFLGSRTALEYAVQTDLPTNIGSKRSLMHISDECFVRFGVTIVLRSQSLYTDPFNKVLLRARQSGLIRKIQRDVEWNVQRSPTGNFLQVIKGFAPKVQIEDRKLNLDDTQGMFLVLGSGFLIAMLAFSLEYICHLIRKRCCGKTKIKVINVTNESELSDGSAEVIAQEKVVDISGLQDPQPDEIRIKRTEWVILIAICTHLDCVLLPNAGSLPGGFYCPLHGSHFDGTGRV